MSGQHHCRGSDGQLQWQAHLALSLAVSIASGKLFNLVKPPFSHL